MQSWEQILFLGGGVCLRGDGFFKRDFDGECGTGEVLICGRSRGMEVERLLPREDVSTVLFVPLSRRPVGIKGFGTTLKFYKTIFTNSVLPPAPADNTVAAATLKWRRPKAGWLKLNTDGDWKKETGLGTD
ncbi:hypothetical protein LIER_43062 [Lithospermum erythrorhizon]|uniref:Uncharacterized protein n=1 Tax=Lithospermum erythrorhizon TaxID=34254 RepID=A0AAV3PCP8_LITER